MRELSTYAVRSGSVKLLLAQIADKNTSSSEYGLAFYNLGQELAKVINSEFHLKDKSVQIACSSEDADLLSNGLIKNLEANNKFLAVFWNLRQTVPHTNEQIAPIVQSYIEPGYAHVLIICKSIIFTSCVVRTNLTNLIQESAPNTIIIAAPVIFRGAENALKNEFPKEIADRFEFIFFARDNEVNKNNEVVPGIGGSIYERLGLGKSISKNKYMPDVVKQRLAFVK